MKVDDLKTLRVLMGDLKAAGVRVFRAGDLHIEFASPESAEPTKMVTLDDGQKPLECPCGHAVWEHVNGLCAVCADPSKCAEKPAPA